MMETWMKTKDSPGPQSAGSPQSRGGGCHQYAAGPQSVCGPKKKLKTTEKIKKLKNIFEKQEEVPIQKKEDGRKRKNMEWDKVTKKERNSVSGPEKLPLPLTLKKVDRQNGLDLDKKREGESVGGSKKKMLEGNRKR